MHPMGLLLRNLKKKYVGPDGSIVPVIDVPELFISDGEPRPEQHGHF